MRGQTWAEEWKDAPPSDKDDASTETDSWTSHEAGQTVKTAALRPRVASPDEEAEALAASRTLATEAAVKGPAWRK